MSQPQGEGADAGPARATQRRSQQGRSASYRQGRSATYRLLHLSFVLLSARRPLTRAQIFERVEEYREAPESSRNRTFERDKALLRSNGFGLEVVRIGDDFSGLEEDAYRIRHNDAQLPPMTFSPQEQQLLTAAQGAWRGTALSQPAQLGVAKLLHDLGPDESDQDGASSDAGQTPSEVPEGAVPDTGRAPALGGLQLALAGGVDARVFEALAGAQRDGRVVHFDYRRSAAGLPGQRATTARRLEPWALGQRKGFWYLVGRDLDRGEQRVFKLNRIVGLPVPHGPAGVVRRPDDLDVAAVLAALGPAPDEPTTAVVAIRGEYAPQLRRGAEPVERPAPEGYRAYRVQVGDAGGFIGQVAMAGPDVIVLEPESLRSAMIAHLRAILESEAPAGAEPLGRTGESDAHQ